MNVFTEYPILIPIVAGVVSELTKTATLYWHEQRITGKDFFRSGGMPSGHSAFAAALSLTMLHSYGAKSPEFTLATAFAIIVVIDAIKFRRAAGLHAAALNKIAKNNALDERLGHSPLEVFAGILFGAVIALILLSF